jgi:DNA-binding GntR family transcriptional regulator
MKHKVTDSFTNGNCMSNAYDRIKESILKGYFAPGTRLSQVKIADRLGLSRTPVREALRLIEKEGLVTSERGRQIVISSTSMADLDELYALRVKLDTATVRTSVTDLSLEDLDEMQNCLITMDTNEALEDFATFDADHRLFHMIAIRRAGPRHVDYSAQLNEHAERYRGIYMGHTNSQSQSKAEHNDIFAACTIRDGDQVACLLAEHYARIALTIIAQIEPRLVRAAIGAALANRVTPNRCSSLGHRPGGGKKIAHRAKSVVPELRPISRDYMNPYHAYIKTTPI